jgi:hypothetical protein
MTKKLPKVLFCKWLEDGQDDSWLNASETINELAEKDVKDTVGRYELVETMKVTLEVKSEVVITKQ